MTKEEEKFILSVTDHFHGHWEDPEWGKRLLKAMSILANSVADAGMRTNIQRGIENAVAKVSSQDPIPPSSRQSDVRVHSKG